MLWFSSDYHISHDNIIRFCGRPFKDVADMQQALIERHNSVVAPDDVVYLVGDTFWDKSDWSPDSVTRFLRRLNGTIILLPGNHDDKTLRKYMGSISYERAMPEIEYGDASFVAFHYPMLSWPKSFHGSICVHGHTHSKQKHTVPDRRLVNVCVDAWDFYPASAVQIIDLVKNVKAGIE